MEQFSPLSTVSTIHSAGIPQNSKFERQYFDPKPRLKSTLNLLTSRSESSQDPSQIYKIFIQSKEREKIKRSETQVKLQKLEVKQKNESMDLENNESFSEFRQIFLPDAYTVGEAIGEILELENIEGHPNDYILTVAKKNGRPKNDIPRKINLFHVRDSKEKLISK